MRGGEGEERPTDLLVAMLGNRSGTAPEPL